jgi:hypothetical protein
MLKQASAEQGVLENKSEVVGKPEAIMVDGQGTSSLEEEGTAEVIQKTGSFRKPETSDNIAKLFVVEKEPTLKDSPRTPQRSAKITVTYKDDASEESDIESDMKLVVVKKEAAVKDSPATHKDKGEESDIESVSVHKIVSV